MVQLSGCCVTDMFPSSYIFAANFIYQRYVDCVCIHTIRDLKELASEAGVIARDKHLTIFRIADESDDQRPDLLLDK